MARPPLEVADLVRAAGDAFIERNRDGGTNVWFGGGEFDCEPFANDERLESFAGRKGREARQVPGIDLGIGREDRCAGEE